mmetsp:Transcript_30066/g.39575  ORF Transcript_30066/g.39575 Transcript_30066/m.39575 type:complete len:143 (+) Transcript_30066:110-538(+)|eukprot:CAMPEP_0117761980 /NCGR_PEP_ID=MMETSP0947-20121206/17622_1 /TAXON_ID=44440 /ORGANISM="Chattonella subsalsa, Strain CCMP2191" /LENGTH=142 /DNA_ID=CAMNT_0005583113 /DNA_START=78 /DNA_END=506 /DNA_ORIENTATION=+
MKQSSFNLVIANILLMCNVISGFVIPSTPLCTNNGKKLFAENNDSPQEPEKPKMNFEALVQLVTMGAGAPSLGEFQGVDEDGKLMFELEANNYVDSEGNLKRNKYVDEGWVDNSEDKAPGFFENLLSGGKLQSEYRKKQQSK